MCQGEIFQADDEVAVVPVGSNAPWHHVAPAWVESACSRLANEPRRRTWAVYEVVLFKGSLRFLSEEVPSVEMWHTDDMVHGCHIRGWNTSLHCSLDDGKGNWSIRPVMIMMRTLARTFG